MRRYENAEVALNTGMILHEMLRHEPLAKSLLHSDRLYDFIGYIDKTTFGIACDAQANFKVDRSTSAENPESRLIADPALALSQELLTRHKPMVADFLDKNYDEVS